MEMTRYNLNRAVIEVAQRIAAEAEIRALALDAHFAWQLR
jgi:hypothetical protein